ncbi:MAG: glutathione S-transferase [Pseudomonas sp.]|uniref:glutathione S-transferase n=1 Tax=Pseudomonas abieticivorans TaxID=2931382 RepID=UPI00238F6B16|nr:glutathione S-transferase [Pseudomonas sp. PIA16]MDE1165678.1 glutathione S-transferase [Pseudomonas sp.]
MILYSFRRCPYAMRARMALRYSQVPISVVEVSLKAKPAEMLALSGKGTVPVLDLGVEGVIDESLQIMLWALGQNDPEDWQRIGNPLLQREMADVIRYNDEVFKGHLNHYKYAERYPEQPMAHYREQGCVFLRQLDERLHQHRFLFGEHLSLADVAVAPFIRQFRAVDPQWFVQSPYGALEQWIKAFLDTTLFKAIMAK